MLYGSRLWVWCYKNLSYLSVFAFFINGIALIVSLGFWVIWAMEILSQQMNIYIYVKHF